VTQADVIGGRQLARVDFKDGAYDKSGEDLFVPDVSTANLITSLVSAAPMHKPVIDIDIPAKLWPSSTPGHSHLYIDIEMPWSKYVTLLTALMEAGIVEPGYVKASIARGYTAVRPPWVSKYEGGASAEVDCE
jgi:hypothetical protein